MRDWRSSVANEHCSPLYYNAINKRAAENGTRGTKLPISNRYKHTYIFGTHSQEYYLLFPLASTDLRVLIVYYFQGKYYILYIYKIALFSVFLSELRTRPYNDILHRYYFGCLHVKQLFFFFLMKSVETYKYIVIYVNIIVYSFLIRLGLGTYVFFGNLIEKRLRCVYYILNTLRRGRWKKSELISM